MKNFKALPLIILLAFSCTKQEFQTNKSSQTSTITSVTSTSTQLCSQSTLVKPKVDILMLWDNSSSFNFVTNDTKTSMSNLISSVSEKFDYHVLNAPLVPANSASMYEMSLIASDTSSVNGSATAILKTKETAISTLAFSQGAGGSEAGIDRAYNVITANRSNGIFRDGAYTIVVLMSNEDDKGCELATGYNTCTQSDKNNYLLSKKQKMLCLRGNTSAYNCSGYPTLNSSMMRFITISPLSLCSSGLNKINYNYKSLSKFIYESSYNNGWPTSNDHLNPDVSGYPDSYNLCTINFSGIFDGVNSAIKQTLIKHVYSFWPVASSTASVDPDTLVVTRDDGKVLVNRTGESSPTDGFGYIDVQTNHATRSFPTAGEPFTGKMIELFGTNDNDLVVYPHCLTVSYKGVKSNYGYVFLTNGEPYTPTIEVKINNSIVPQSTTNGWSYMGLQYVSALDANYKVANLPNGATSGYIIKLNGTYQVTNSNTVNIQVYYTSKSN
jgi:hypothetical protein